MFDFKVYNNACIVWPKRMHTPSPIAKVIIIVFIWILIHMDTTTKKVLQSIWLQKKNEWGLFSTSTCHQLLFSCFFNILSLHLPSFFWSYKVHKAKCIALLEHILHYYFTFALVLHFFIKIHENFKVTVFNEMIVATQMSLYFLWHIYREIKSGSYHTQKRCTLFSDFIEMSILIFVIAIIPIFWANIFAEQDSLFKDGFLCFHPNSTAMLPENTSVLFQLGYLYSTFVVCDLGSIAFHFMERLYLVIFTSTSNSDQ